MKNEFELSPDFDKQKHEVIRFSSNYLDLIGLNDNFDYTYGNHLHTDSGKVVPEIITNQINIGRK
ncbi:hypothetical protein [Patiriisocius marinus]|uniref:Uncharacterized protein n=1 Tax=Patiriisocius marinus TaxID=1397112 RepID=A0A5J4J1N4_9FLAO|nr:hypothetical protein [Patiriisocius marinus]GER59691.1 hypothetical protein ULMA_17990 [Patiriisocius marinus]